MALGKYGKWSYDMVGGMYRVFCGEGMQTREYSTLGEARQVCQELHIRDLEIENAELRKRDVINNIIASGTRLYHEFGLVPTREVTTEVYTDEFAELLDELISDPPNKAKITDEFGDALYTLVMAVQMHLSPAEMHDAIGAVLAKNDAKTTKDYMLVNGIIKSKAKMKQVSP